VIYLDANVIIRAVEGDAAARQPVEAAFRAARTPSGPFLLTSTLSRIECRCKPLEANDVALLALYDTFFAAVELALADIAGPVVDVATEFRARYHFKVPDCIHLATAITFSASAFLTGDKALARFAEVRVQVV
jgi:predicted nucleic acid-binding protein